MHEVRERFLVPEVRERFLVPDVRERFLVPEVRERFPHSKEYLTECVPL